MSKNQKSKNNALTRLYNILDYNSKKNINLKNERYLGSLSHRLKEISGEEVYYRKKLDSKIEDNGVKSLEPKVIIHRREVKKEPDIIEPKIEEKKSVFRDEDVLVINFDGNQVGDIELVWTGIEGFDRDVGLDALYISPNNIPEPGMTMLVGTCLGLFVLRFRRRG